MRKLGQSPGKQPATVELFDRSEGAWKKRVPEGGAYRFDLGRAGGELLRITGHGVE